ncbi:MAG: hypothetical protein IKK77_03640 [Clostridia bacterium]|nr:hypothetical protein [Clostridia bacterium]
MKNKIFSLVLIFILIISCNYPVATAVTHEETPQNTEYARFENMLNHNKLYGSDFNDINKVVDNSILCLRDRAEDEFIKKDLVEAFVYNMYDLDIKGYEPNPNAPTKDGYIFIMPRGYEEFSHKVISVTKNGTLNCVISEITVKTHDGEVETTTCETVLLENEKSAFGYNIISSNIQ